MATASGGASTIVLTEEDIRGASLKEPLDKHTMSELRWWLLCRRFTAPTSWKKAQLIHRVREMTQEGVPVSDVDGSYMYRKQQQLLSQGINVVMSPPCPPMTGWEVITADNVKDMSSKIPCVTSGMMYTYLAAGCSRKDIESQGAFRALQRGYVHWASGRLDQLEVNYRHPEYCHIRCKMTPSMKSGIYHVYLLLGKDGQLAKILKATCECAAGESASCTHVSASLHALVSAGTSHTIACATTSQDMYSDDSTTEECLPITSFACAWKPPRKRKESNMKIAEVSFQKHVYGRQVKHELLPLTNYDPRPVDCRGTTPELLSKFLTKVKGKGLGVSVLLDKDMQVWQSGDSDSLFPEGHNLPSNSEIKERVSAFKKTLTLTSEQIRKLERDTLDQSCSPLWYFARRYRITASMFGRIILRRPTTPADSIIKQLLHPKPFYNKATEWGKEKEPEALKKYVEYKQQLLGCENLIVGKAGFVVWEKYPFLGASPDSYVHDPSCINQFGVVEIKCPYKYHATTPEIAATCSDFCCSLFEHPDKHKTLKLKRNHQYYYQIQGQMAITERLWCDFVIYTQKGISVERIQFDSNLWEKECLPKLIDFYDNSLCPAIVCPLHLLGVKVRNLSIS